jgi:hypothetical protein
LRLAGLRLRRPRRLRSRQRWSLYVASGMSREGLRATGEHRGRDRGTPRSSTAFGSRTRPEAGQFACQEIVPIWCRHRRRRVPVHGITRIQEPTR